MTTDASNESEEVELTSNARHLQRGERASGMSLAANASRSNIMNAEHGSQMVKAS